MKLTTVLIIALFFLTGLGNANDMTGLSWLKSGNHFAIMRHAIAPGFGDPTNFELRDCSTQRNLSTEGFEQSARIGKRFRDAGINKAQVFTSQWCRCIDTAKTLDIGVPEELPAMNSFFQAQERKTMQTQALREWLAKQDLTKPLVLVTHQVNMTALTGAYPASGEVFIVERSEAGEFTIVDRVKID